MLWMVLAVVLIWSGIAAHISQERADSLRTAMDTTGNLARGFGESVVRTVAGVDQLMRVLRNAYSANPAGFDLAKLASGDQVLDAATIQIAVTDRHGMMTASTIPHARLADLSDRKHIYVQMQTDADDLYISPPVFGRVSHIWSLQFTRKMFNQDGAMDGVLVVSLDPSYFSRFYHTLGIGQGSVMLIGIEDGVVRAHQPEIAGDIGRTANDQMLRHIREGAETGTFQAQDQFDGVARIYTYRRLDHYGLAVVVGFATGEVFAQYYADMRIYIAIGLYVTLLVILVGVALLAQRRRQLISQAQLSATLETIEQGIMMIGPDGRTPVINRRAIELLGLPPDLIRDNLRHGDIVRWQVANGEFSASDAVQFDPILDVGSDVGMFIRGGQMPHPVYERLRPNGTILEVRTHPMQDGGAVRSFTDVTSRRQAEQDLQRAQTLLGRAERMEAIGQLTGGIAHDFNNLLAVVVGNLDMLTDETEEGSQPRLMVTESLTAALHGAALVSQLLAFARKLPLAPQTVDINQLTTGMVALLDRALGGSIVLTLRKDPRLWLVTADTSQLETAILNLAINARDAMPAGGTLQLETSCVTLSAADVADIADASSGDHVLLSMTDSGTGMSPEVVARVFDPFFTTKPEGKGTGLGLSMVYGFTHQSGGHVLIDSTPGVGTTVRLYLPRGRESWVADALATDHESSLPRGSEVILVVDDNLGVRETAIRILTSLGYMVLNAADGPGALQVLASTHRVDLLFSDVIMPGGIDGPTLARMAMAKRPDLAVLLTSGYVETASEAADPGSVPWDMLDKPYRVQELAARVRNALDRQRRARKPAAGTTIAGA